MTDQQNRPTIRSSDDLLARMGQLLDDADFAAAHDSVRPEIAAAIQTAEDPATTTYTSTSGWLARAIGRIFG